MITLGSDADALFEALAAAGLEAAEIYRKVGRSRTTVLQRSEGICELTEERGWAVRAGTSRGSWMATGVGEPRREGPWPELDGGGLRLPPPSLASAVSDGAAASRELASSRELDLPLLGEGEATALLRTIEATLTSELDGARLLSAALEDGAASIAIANSLGLRSQYRQRVAVLHLWASWEGSDVRLYAGAREPRQFEVAAQARRLVDRLMVLEHGMPIERDRCEVVLAPEPAAVLLRALSPLFADASGFRRLGMLATRSGRVGSERWTVIDDGGLASGLLAAPADGEGVATRSVTLLDRGRPMQPLRTWRESDEGWSGCVRRASYRDVPRRGFTHLFLAPERSRAPAELVASVARGLYALEAEGTPTIDVDEDRFVLPVAGFRLRAGQATAAVRGCEVVGTLRGLFQGLEGVGRDLRFLPFEACFGSPTLLFSGLETRPR